MSATMEGGELIVWQQHIIKVHRLGKLTRITLWLNPKHKPLLETFKL